MNGIIVFAISQIPSVFCLSVCHQDLVDFRLPQYTIMYNSTCKIIHIMYIPSKYLVRLELYLENSNFQDGKCNDI